MGGGVEIFRQIPPMWRVESWALLDEKELFTFFHLSQYHSTSNFNFVPIPV